GDQRQLDAQLLQPVERLVRIGEQQQFLVVQGVVGVGQCVTDRLGRDRMAGRRERSKGGRDDAAARGTGAVAPVFVPRLIGPQFSRDRLDRRRNDRRLYRPELVGEGGDGTLPLRLRRPKRNEDRVVEIEKNRARQFHVSLLSRVCGAVEALVRGRQR